LTGTSRTSTSPTSTSCCPTTPPAAIDLVDTLTRTSPRFKAIWNTHDVRRTDTDTLDVDLPKGRVSLTLVNLQGVASPGIRFNAYLPGCHAPDGLPIGVSREA